MLIGKFSYNIGIKRVTSYYFTFIDDFEPKLGALCCSVDVVQFGPAMYGLLCQINACFPFPYFSGTTCLSFFGTRVLVLSFTCFLN